MNNNTNTSTITITTTTTTNNNNNNANNNNHHRISNGTQACAACKYQRRKCAPDCVLAPYFPHDRQRQFLNAHKLFGVSNITKIIRNLNVPDKDIAMRTIMYQSDARAKDPVGGCYRIIRDLQYQIEYCKAELELVLQQLALCKAQAYQQQQSQMLQIGHQQHQVIPEVACNSGNNNNNCNDGNHSNINNEEHYQYQESLMRCYYEGDDQGGVVQYVGIQQNDQENLENDQFSWTPHDDAVLGSSNSSNSHGGEGFMVKRDFESECDGLPMKLMRLDSADPPHQYDDSHHVDITSDAIQGDGLEFGCQATTELSDEIVLRDDKIILGNQDEESFHHHDHIAEHDLRSAATLFTLTS